MKLRSLIKSTLLIGFLFIQLATLIGQTTDLDVLYRIKQEGFKASEIEKLSFIMTDLAGPRLTASDGSNRANELARKQMVEMGFSNVRIEEARPFERGGWDNLKCYAAMSAPYYANFAVTPVAWTGSTKGLVKGSVVLADIKSESDMDKLKGKLMGKIVLIPANSGYEVSFEPLAERYDQDDLARITSAGYDQSGRRRGNFDMEAYRAQMSLRSKISEFLKTEGVAVVVNSSGTFNVPRSNGANPRPGEPELIPEINLPVEAHGRMERMLRNNTPVEMEVEVINKFNDTKKVFNVIGEIPGSDPKLKDEIVLLGGHIDSWHGGTGAADNASGCIVMMEALRIIKKLNLSPKRTIRVALWGGEEQGLHGSRGYVEKYLMDSDGKKLPGYDKFSVYFNMDNGTGKFRGIYLQENDMVRPLFENWLKAFADMDASAISIRNTGGTDHQSFDGVGLPGFQFIQDPIEYGRGYHTNMDTWERLIMGDLKHNAVVVATLAYHAAMMDGKVPRKPYTPRVAR